MPVDTGKTIMQMEGKDGLDRLLGEVMDGDRDGAGLAVLYRGSLAAVAAAAAAAVGCFPWFLT